MQQNNTRVMSKKGDLEKYYVKTLTDATFYSYGNCKGNFKMTLDELLESLNESNGSILDDYCLVEKKSLKYVFMVDIDFKDKVEPFTNVNGKKFPGNGDSFIHYNGKEEEITQYLINIINQTVGTDKYIYCDKWIGETSKQGIHLYYPEIMVDNKSHHEIFNKVFKQIMKDTKYTFTEKIWRIILDTSIASPHVSLRLPYFKLEGASYKPNKDKSTYVFPDDIKEQIKIICKN